MSNFQNLSNLSDEEFVINIDGNPQPQLQNQQTINQNSDQFANNNLQNQNDDVIDQNDNQKVDNQNSITNNQINDQDDDQDDDQINDQNNDQDDDQNDDQNDDSDEYSDYSQAALFAKALEEEGISIIPKESFSKDMKATDFINGFKNFTSEVVKQQMQQLGDTAKYVQYLIENGASNESLQNISPALELEEYINYNLKDPDVVEDDYEIIVRAMYERQVQNPELVDTLIEADKNNNVLSAKAEKAQEFLKNYRNQLIQNAQINAQKQKQLEYQRLEQESQQFVGALSSLDEIAGIKISDTERAKLYDMMYKRDKVVSYVDPNTGKQVQDVLTGYEYKIYEVVNNPSKLAHLLFFLENDFNMNRLTNSNMRKVNKSIINAIDSNKNKISNEPNVNINTHSGNTQNISPDGEEILAVI